MKKKALVTGGAGFIGSNLIARLLKDNWEVILYDNLSRPKSEVNLVWLLNEFKSPNLHIEIKDIRDFQSIKDAVSKVEVVFHLASQTAVTTSFLNPRHDFEVNAMGSFNVVEAARESTHKPIVIYSSTNKVYGGMDSVSVREDKTRYVYENAIEGIDEHFQLDFHSPYGCSKGVSDQYTRDYYRMYDVPTVVFRQSCIYGPRQLGVEDQGWAAHFAISAHMGRPITIFGDGKQVRDLLYVDDLIDAYLLAVENIDDVKGQVFNIGGGLNNSLSILEYINFLEDTMKLKIKTHKSEWRPGDQRVFIADTGKIEKVLNWKINNPYKKGLQKLINWTGENKNLFG